MRNSGSSPGFKSHKHPTSWANAVYFLAQLTLGILIFVLLESPDCHAAGANGWIQHEGYRSQPLTKLSTNTAPPGFNRIQPRGLQFTNRLSEILALNNQILENGAGIALGDIDGDGRVDLYFCGSENGNKLFRNLGRWEFQDVTQAARVECMGQFSTGAAFADVDGDGDLDLLVNSLGQGTRLFLNGGRGQFREMLESGLARTGAATSLTLADIDHDGDLDLYVTRYRVSSARNDPNPPQIEARVSGQRVTVSPADRFTGILRSNGQVEVVEKGEADTLYLNQGNGRFKSTSWTDGRFMDVQGQPLKSAPEEWGLSALLRDLNGDGNPDLYVCNDFYRSPDELWWGDGKGSFRAADPLVFRDFPLSSMAVDVADINRDGWDDFLVAEMLSRDPAMRQRQRANAMRMDFGASTPSPTQQMEMMHNTLMLGRGDGSFAQIAHYSGLAATDWTWGVAWLDVDLDGWPDLLAINGNNHDVLDMDAQNQLDRSTPQSQKQGLEHYPPLPQRNLAFRNQRDLTFQDMSADWGFHDLGISQAMALADLDQDGDMDVVVGNLNESVWLYENRGTASRIQVKLLGHPPNTKAIGARVTLLTSSGRQTHIITAGGRYLCADSTEITFAWENQTGASLQIQWPSGALQEIRVNDGNERYEITEPANLSSPSAPNPTTNAPALFRRTISQAAPIHTPLPHDDFALQRILPYRWSELGPGISFGLALQGSNMACLLPLGSKMGLTALEFTSRASWISQELQPPTSTPFPDSETLSTLSVGQTVWFTIAHNKPSSTDPTLYHWNAQDGWVGHAPGQTYGPLAAADLNGDGNLEVFAGGIPGPNTFPRASHSILLESRGGVWSINKTWSSNLIHIGFVGGATFFDADSDGGQDLAIAEHWGRIRIFQNQSGQLIESLVPFQSTEKSPPPLPTGMQRSWTGLWRGIVSGDWDGDGRLDLAVANAGLNHSRAEHLPWILYHGDISGQGNVDCLEAYYDRQKRRIFGAQGFDRILSAFPFVSEKAATYQAWSETPMDEILGDRLPTLRTIQVDEFRSGVFLQRSNHWEWIPLPAEAQFSTAFCPVVADWNGDGKEDLFLSQNFSGVDAESSRQDAGTGLILLGNGAGHFDPLSVRASGIRMDGDQRGALTADLNGDFKPDLVVGRRGESVSAWINQTAKPGLSVRLTGPPGNPFAGGASLFIRTQNGSGPKRFIALGSGFLSSSSPVTVLPSPLLPADLIVQWPHGGVSTHPLKPEMMQKEITIQIPQR